MRIRVRLAMMFLAFGVAPIALANIYGVSTVCRSEALRGASPGSAGPTALYREARAYEWIHGWPLPLTVRRGYLGSGDRGGARWNAPAGPDDVHVELSSRWPFDGAVVFPRWRAQYASVNVLFLDVLVWIILLAGVGYAAARSRFVNCGRPQFQLLPFCLTTACLPALTVGYCDAVSALQGAAIVPALVCAISGYAQLLQGRKSRAERAAMWE